MLPYPLGLHYTLPLYGSNVVQRAYNAYLMLSRHYVTISVAMDESMQYSLALLQHRLSVLLFGR